MAKNNVNGAAGGSTVHIVLQGKGGVGKSFTSWLLAQYLHDKGHSVKGIDTDANNKTFTQYKSIAAEPLKLSENGLDIEPVRFDEMMQRLLTEPGPFVVDTGSNTFGALWKYMIENSALEMLHSAGRRVILHVLVVGGSDMMDTLNGFNQVAHHAPAEKSIVVWLNEFHGKVEHRDGDAVKTFGDMKAFTQNESKVLGAVVLTKRSADTFGRDLQDITTKRLTFTEALASDSINLMTKQRLKVTQRDVYDQLDKVGV
jgi:hypothetical protein